MPIALPVPEGVLNLSSSIVFSAYLQLRARVHGSNWGADKKAKKFLKTIDLPVASYVNLLIFIEITNE